MRPVSCCGKIRWVLCRRDSRLKAHGANGDEEHGELMAKDDAEAAVVDANDAVEGAFCEAVREVVFPFSWRRSGRTSWAW